MSTTRKKTTIPFLGQPGSLPNFDLPSNSDVIKCIKYMQVRKNEHVNNIISCPVSNTDPNAMACKGSSCCLLNSKLTKFNWRAILGTPMESQANDALNYSIFALYTQTFTRGDYRELCELIVVYHWRPS